MSEWCQFPLNDTETTFTQTDKTFEGSGAIYTPFTMFNLSDEYDMTWVRNTNGQAFVSNMPLTDGNYWLFYLWCDEGTTLKNRYTQGELISTGNFKFYFSFTPKPLLMGNINSVKRLPSISKTQLVRFGDIGLPKQNAIQFKNLDYDSITRTLTEKECLKILYQREKYNEEMSLHDMYPLWQPTS